MDDQLTAVVSISGAGRASEEACAPVSSLAVLEVHGDADPTVRFEGGRVFDDRRLAPHPSAPQTMQDWAERLRCPVTRAPKVTMVDLDPRLPGAETRIESYACPGGAAELWTVHGGGHQLMTPALVARVGAFLAAHPKGVRAEAAEKPKARPKRRR
jgi:polyhydroxybutyrate depolymerase